MPIRVHCEGCGKAYSVPAQYAGKRGKCPYGHLLIVPPQLGPPPKQNDEKRWRQLIRKMSESCGLLVPDDQDEDAYLEEVARTAAVLLEALPAATSWIAGRLADQDKKARDETFSALSNVADHCLAQNYRLFFDCVTKVSAQVHPEIRANLGGLLTGPTFDTLLTEAERQVRDQLLGKQPQAPQSDSHNAHESLEEEEEPAESWEERQAAQMAAEQWWAEHRAEQEAAEWRSRNEQIDRVRECDHDWEYYYDGGDGRGVCRKCGLRC